MTWILHSLTSIPAPAAYALVGGLAFGEAVFLLGFILPGETAVVLGGVIASQGRVSLPVMMAVVATGAVLGDSLSYEIGHRFGPGLLSRPWFARRERAVRSIRRLRGLHLSGGVLVGAPHGTHVDAGQRDIAPVNWRPRRRLMDRWGAWAVVAGRFTAYIRPVVPALAGAVGMSYRRFLIANTAGAVAWAAAFSALGYGLGNAYTRATRPVQWGSLGVLALGVGTILVVHWHHRRSADRLVVLTTSPRPVGSQPSRDTPSTEVAGTGVPPYVGVADLGDSSQTLVPPTTLPQVRPLTHPERILAVENSLVPAAFGPDVVIRGVR